MRDVGGGSKCTSPLARCGTPPFPTSGPQGRHRRYLASGGTGGSGEDGWFACGYRSLTPRPRARVAYAGDERIAPMNSICNSVGPDGQLGPLPIPSPPTMELTAWAKLLKATMEFDREREGDQGRGQHPASAAREPEAVALQPKRQQDKSPPGDQVPLRQPTGVPEAGASKAQEGGGGCPSSPGPKARPAPMATKSAPPQPPEVLAATSKAKPAQAKTSGGPDGATPRLAAGQPPQEEAASEYYYLYVAPRAAGWLPDIGDKQPTCFPVKGEPTEKDFFLVSHCLRGELPPTNSCPWGSSPRTKRSDSPSSWPPSGNRSKPSGSPDRSRTLKWGGAPPGRSPSPLDQGGDRWHGGPAGLGCLDQGS